LLTALDVLNNSSENCICLQRL